MATNIAPPSRKRRTKPSRTIERKIESTNRYHEYSAKRFVTFTIGRFVRDNEATLEMLANGEFELRLATGEIFHLSETTITRVA
jgi:hypothetical protein